MIARENGLRLTLDLSRAFREKNGPTCMLPYRKAFVGSEEAPRWLNSSPTIAACGITWIFPI